MTDDELKVLRSLADEVAQRDRDWCKMLVAIADAVGTADEREVADAEDPHFTEQYDPWEALRDAKAEMDQLRARVAELEALVEKYRDKDDAGAAFIAALQTRVTELEAQARGREAYVENVCKAQDRAERHLRSSDVLRRKMCETLQRLLVDIGWLPEDMRLEDRDVAAEVAVDHERAIKQAEAEERDACLRAIESNACDTAAEAIAAIRARKP